MPIDTRAVVTCSLGTLISGSISDGYLQGNGLVLTQGAVELSGTYTPAVGTVVTVAYKYNGGTRNVPRKLRVLSSFADPLRRTTRVQLGCKLTYLSDLRQRLKWSALDDPENAGLSAADAEIITIPIHAASVFAKCLTELGLTASSNPLTNRFSVAEYDYSAGYVAVIAELLTSENYFGYLDFSEVLQVVSLNQNGGTGPVVTEAQIIDLSDINAGALPGEAVTVSYSSLQLKAAPELDDWSTSRSSNRSSVTISYNDPLDGSRQTILYSVLETEEETSDFQALTKASTGERLNVLRYRKVERKESSPKVLGSVMVQFLEAGISPPVAQLVTTTEEWFYYDAEGNEIRTVKETYADRAYGFGQVSLPMVIDAVVNGVNVKQAVSLPIGQTYLQDAVETETTVQGTLRKVVTRRYGNWLATIAGQQSVAESRESFTTTAQVEQYLATALSGKWLLGVDIRTEDNTSSSQRVPFKPEVINQQYSKGGNPANGYRTESSAEVVLALGSATAQRRTEFSLPKAPDDYFYKSGGSYGSIQSNARSKAKAYGTVQNRLLLGNRSGMNLRLHPTQMPEAPFGALIVKLQGQACLYRVNGTSWTFNAEGIVAATDALFWGAVGGSGTRWYPLAPGVSTLPSLPATTTVNVTGVNDSAQTVTIAQQTQMVVPAVIQPYNETAVLAPTTRAGLVVTSLPYALTATTAQAITTKAKMTGRRVRLVDVPAAAVAVAGEVPAVSIGAAVFAPVAAITVQSLTPTLASGASVIVPSLGIAVEGAAPIQAGRLKTQVLVPAVDLAVAATAPSVFTGSSIAPPASDVAIAAAIPAGIGSFDPHFTNVSLSLHMDGSNNSTTFTDKSNNAFAVTVNGDAKVSTAQSKFGGASLLLDGTGDYLSVSDAAALDMETGDFTIEFWFLWDASQTTSFPRLLSKGVYATAGTLEICLNPSNGNVFAIYGSGATSIGFGGATTSGNWHHFLMSRSGTTLRGFVNGTQGGSSPYTVSENFANSTALLIGTSQASEPFKGHIDEVQVTKGIARRTANFTVADLPHPDR